jgi:dTDP-glucose 4,6-dehydratase
MSRTILITGMAGFFGHHLLEHILINTDWNVVGLEGINYAGNLGRIKDIEAFENNEHRVKFVWHDLRSPINETVIHQIGQVDYVVNVAAETHVDRSLVDSVPFVLTNVLGTCHLLEYVRHNQPSIVKYNQFSTDEVFGAAPFGVDHKEWGKHKPSNPYAATKAGADDLAYAFAHSFKLPVIITHTMNMFGERQNVEKFIPMTIRKILLGETITIHGTEGSISTRKWIHCRNAADALLFLLDKGETEDKYNIVGDELDVLSIAKIIAHIIGKPLNYEYLDFHSTRPGHDLRYSLDGSKLQNMGWSPPIPFLETLEKVVLWTLENKTWINL